MVKIIIEIDGYPFFELRKRSVESIDLMDTQMKFDDHCSKYGIGDGSLRVFYSVVKLKYLAPDIYVVNSDGEIMGEGYIKEIK